MVDSPDHPPSPPPPPPPPPQRRRWLPERTDDRYLGGVAGAFAHAGDVDPFLVRIALALAVLYMPWLVVLYALAWLVMPDARAHRSLLADAVTPHGWPAATGVAALGIGAAILTPKLGPGGDVDVTWGALLLGIGFLLVTGRGGRAIPGRRGGNAPIAGSPAPAPARAPGDAGAGTDLGAEGAATGLGPAGSAATATTNAPLWRCRPPSRPPRPPSTLGWMGISGLLVLVGALVAADQAWGSVRPGVAVSLCLLLVGLVLVVAARWGRARLLMPVGALLLPLWVGFSVTDVPRYDGDGDRDVAVGADDRFPRQAELGYGTLDVDLAHASFPPGARRRLRVGLTAGRARVDVPRDVHLDIDGDVGFGAVEVFDGWRTERGGPVWPGGVSMQVGDPRQRCEASTVYPDLPDGPDVPEEQVFPGPPDTPGVGTTGKPTTTTTVPETTTTTRVEYHDDVTGARCVPSKPRKDPATLQLLLDVGVGSVEVHRV